MDRVLLFHLRTFCLPLCVLVLASELSGAEFYLAPTGQDTADGSLAHPFASLERARAAVRATRDSSGQLPEGGATVFLRGGLYLRSDTFTLGPADSGTAKTPVTYRNYPGESPRLTGACPLQPGWFTAVDQGSPAWDRLAPEARGQVLEISLPDHGITNYGSLRQRGMYEKRPAALELFIGDRPMPLAQWPDADDASVRCLGCGFALIEQVSSPTSFVVPGDRIARWARAPDAWFHGYWGNMWSDFHLPARSFDVEHRTVTLAAAPRFRIKPGQPFRIYNLIEEITKPGEWYLDRSNGRLYLWPPRDWPRIEIFVSLLDRELLRLERARQVTIDGLTLEMTRAQLIEIEGGEGNLVIGCSLRNAGTDGASIGGRRNGLANCEITDCGETGALLTGGSRTQLEPGENFIRDCRFARCSRWVWTYAPAIKIEGSGQRVTNNLITDAPHAAIIFGGNNHVIASNEIHDVCLFSNDAGAIYAGRQWAYRGNEIRSNFIHDLHNMLGAEAHGVYLDDCLSGARVTGNVFYKISGAAIVCAGGRDNIMENNLIARCGAALWFDARGVKWINNRPGSDWNLRERLGEPGSDWNLPPPTGGERVRYREEPWSSAYPALAALPDDWSNLSAPGTRWLYPEGCVFSRNLGFANQTFIKCLDFMGGDPAIYRRLLQTEDNRANLDPLFTDETTLHLTLRPDSPIGTIPGFRPIPFDKIGPQPRAAPAAPGGPTEWQVRGGLPNFSAQARSGGEVRVAYLGGSITAADGWRSLTTTFLRQRYPQANIREIFAAIPGTGSDLGACRLADEVLRRQPALLFVEFAVNDSFPSERIQQTIEGIVRQTWRANPSTDICFVYTVSGAGLPDLQAGHLPASVQAMERVAAYYGIPSVHLGVDVVRRLLAGTLLFQAPVSSTDRDGHDANGRLVFTHDNVHPTPAGHRVYFSAIERGWLLLTAITPSPAVRVLGPPLSPDNWEDAHLIPIAEIDRSGAWEPLATADRRVAGPSGLLLPPTWLASVPGAAVEFAFIGKAFGFVGVSGPDCGKFQCTVDRAPPVSGTLFDHYVSPTYFRLRSWFYPFPLDAGEHHVRIELLGAPVDKAGIMEANGQRLDDPKAYEANRLYLSGILAVGKFTTRPPHL